MIVSLCMIAYNEAEALDGGSVRVVLEGVPKEFLV